MGGQMFGGVWGFEDLTVDGKAVEGGGGARPWLEFRDDGTVWGSYGCMPFRVKADLGATELTVGEELPVPAPSATPPPPRDSQGTCEIPGQRKRDQKGQEGQKGEEQQTDGSSGQDARKSAAEDASKKDKQLAELRAKVRKFFRGRLTLTGKKLPPVAGGPPPGSLPRLTNEHGDVATLSVIRAPEFFDIRYELTGWTVYDHIEGYNSGKDLYFDFHPDGTVTGKLGCNDFTAKAYFNGAHLFFRDPERTTHRTCAAPNMADEENVFERLTRPVNYLYIADGVSIEMSDDVNDEHLATGLHFTDITKR
ncbi:META domain-containing protein [Streptomyces sp. NPDC057555]|uniref:META domain-containing protein n=1 Tax=Streptomyces sp. NPDC057555 TaxID=3346166 RepID=UPI0036C57D73